MEFSIKLLSKKETVKMFKDVNEIFLNLNLPASVATETFLVKDLPRKGVVQQLNANWIYMVIFFTIVLMIVTFPKAVHPSSVRSRLQ